jgi:translocator protein
MILITLKIITYESSIQGIDMKFKSNYIIIPLHTIIVALLGKSITKECDAWLWYKTLQLPSMTPPDWVFPIAWNIIFIFTTIVAIIVWNSFERTATFWATITLFCINAAMNVLWSYLFFGNHLIAAALITAIGLEAITITLTVLIYKRSLLTALLLIPYIIWGGFAIYLNAIIWYFN